MNPFYRLADPTYQCGQSPLIGRTVEGREGENNNLLSETIAGDSKDFIRSLAGQEITESDLGENGKQDRGEAEEADSPR